MVLKPYNPDVTCPKCGCKDISAMYYQDVYDHGGITFSERRKLGIEDTVRNFVKRSCRNCHFEWLEAALDTFHHEVEHHEDQD
jgi:hypothetical protein